MTALENAETRKLVLALIQQVGNNNNNNEANQGKVPSCNTNTNLFLLAVDKAQHIL